MRISKRAAAQVGDVYPELPTGKPHYMTRKKQRIAWQLGYIKGFEEARRMILNKHMGEAIDEHDSSIGKSTC